MLERKLVPGSERCAGEDCRLEMGLQPRQTALGAGVSDADGVPPRLGGGLWKRRFAWKSRKERGIPTFPQPRRLRKSVYECYARNPKPGECLTTNGLKMGGRSLKHHLNQIVGQKFSTTYGTKG